MARLNPTSQVRGPARTQASIVDTFVRPPQPDAFYSSGAGSVMNALGVVSNIAKKKQEEKDAADRKRGLMEGLKASLSNDPGKVASGELYPNASPAFMAGLQESSARAQAYQQLSQWGDEYRKEFGDGKHDADPAAFAGWIGDRLDAATAAYQDNEFAIAGAMPVFQMGLTNMMQKHAAASADRVEAKAYSNFDGVLQGMYQQFDWSADPDGSSLIAAVKREADVMVGQGMDGTKVNERVVETFIHMASAGTTVAPLKALITGHKEGSFKLSTKQLAAVEKAEDSVQRELDENERAEERRYKKQKKVWRDGETLDYVAVLAENPDAMPPEYVLRQDPDAFSNMMKIRRELRAAHDEFNEYRDSINEGAVYHLFYSSEVQKMSADQRFVFVTKEMAKRGVKRLPSSIWHRMMEGNHQVSDPKSLFNFRAVQSRWKQYSNFLRAEVKRDGLMPEDLSALEAEFKGHFLEFLSDFQNDPSYDETKQDFRANTDLAKEAAQHAARTMFMDRPKEELDQMFVSNDARNRFMRRLGIDVSDLEDEKKASQKERGRAAFNSGAAPQAEPAQTEEAVEAADRVTESEEQTEPITSLEDLAGRSNVSDVELLELANSMMADAKIAGQIESYSSEEVAAFATALTNAFIEQEAYPNLINFLAQRRNQASE